MKEIYQAPTLEAAGMKLEELDTKWDKNIREQSGHGERIEMN
ncbi:hypothetical protein [Dialister invisus]|jgi:hypothetical protein|nr:hypothetical protein [Dialister invisus]